MAVIGFIKLAQMLNDAGFPGGTAQQTGLAIIAAESGRAPDAKHVNTDGSIDRGLWQINDKFHPEVTDAEAYDPVQATAAALRISSNGGNYGPWSTFQNGQYHGHMEAAAVALDGAHQVRQRQSQLAAAQSTDTADQSQIAALQQHLDEQTAQVTSLTAQVSSLTAKISAAQQALA